MTAPKTMFSSTEQQHEYDATRQVTYRSSITGREIERWWCEPLHAGETRTACVKGCGVAWRVLYRKIDLDLGAQAKFEHELVNTAQRHEATCDGGVIVEEMKALR